MVEVKKLAALLAFEVQMLTAVVAAALLAFEVQMLTAVVAAEILVGCMTGFAVADAFYRPLIDEL